MRKLNMILLVVAMLGGCQMSSPLEPIKYEPRIGENTTPLLVDQAMQVRDWKLSTSNYANGNVPAGPTGFLFEESWNEPEWTYAVVETPLFIGQVLALPVTLALDPP
ncbi:MAG TPA: hypothetical protein VKK61_10605, partial [Tepidisphaeraceae bacterium]|nr:hypothetical protein [Tepidisphaeraceae bacterium]